MVTPTALATIQLYTAAEFETLLTLPEYQGRLLELMHGELVEKMPTEEHGFIATKIARYIDVFIENQQIEGFVGVEVRHRHKADRYNVRLPDVSFRFATSPLVTSGAVLQMPDLTVEIASPDDTLRELRSTAEYYLQHGARLVWLVYPAARKVDVIRFDENQALLIQTVDEKATLDGLPVLTDFALPVTKIFPPREAQS
jgi:Uma2 family endonuclease